jgi:hypothetical protein
MTVKEHINTLKYPGVVFAYIECVLKEGIDVVENLRDLDIENDQYEDVKDLVDELVKQADYCSLADYPIITKEDVLTYFEDSYWEYHGENGEYIKLVEYKREWKKDTWNKFRRLIERTVEDVRRENNSNDTLYECRGYYFIIDPQGHNS